MSSWAQHHLRPRSGRPIRAPGAARSHVGWLVAYALAIAGAFAVFGVNRTLAVAGGLLNIVFLIYFVRHLGFAIAAARWSDADLLAADVDLTGYEPHVAVLVACKNEEVVVDNLASSLLALDYPAEKLSLIVVDDASEDGTGEHLDAWAASHERLRVVHRDPDAGGGKSGALNTALSLVSEAEIAIIFDADHEPDRSVVRRLVRHFRDPAVGAAMGRCIIRNGADSALTATVFVDFLSGYLVNQYGRQALFELPAYGGANCAIRMSTLRELGGWNPNSVTEDTDITLRVLLAGQRVRYDVTAIDYEEAAGDAGRFRRQRHRWARGHQQCFRDYWKPIMASPHLRAVEKVETLLFLLVYHVPVLCGLGVLLTVLRALHIGGLPFFDALPLSMLLFIGPLAELAVGLLQGRVHRRAVWSLLGFLPAFALSILNTTHAYFAGMLARPYTWAKTARSGTVSTVVRTPPAPSGMQAPTVPESRVGPEPLVDEELVIRSGNGVTYEGGGTRLRPVAPRP